MAGASARCGAEDAGIATLEVDSGPSSSRRRTSSTTIFGDQGDRFRLYSMLQKRNSAMTYSESFLKMLSSTLRELWLLRETDLTFDVVPGQSSRMGHELFLTQFEAGESISAIPRWIRGHLHRVNRIFVTILL